MLKTFAMCLALGVIGCALASAMKWAGVFAIPIEFLYGFYDQSPVFEEIHEAAEVPARQIGVLVLAATATAWAVACIPHFARRFVIVLGAVLITFFMSPVLALMGWKLEPFSWIVGLLSAAISAIAVFPGRSQNLDKKEDKEAADMDKDKDKGDDEPSTVSRSQRTGLAGKHSKKAVKLPMRTPEMALAAAEKAALDEGASTADSDDMVEALDEEALPDIHHEASVLVCAVFPPRESANGYSGKVRAFLERASTFLQSVGASDVEVGPDFARAVFLPNDRHVVATCEAALLLNCHLIEFSNASQAAAGSRPSFGIGVEAFNWDALTVELPATVREFARSLSLLCGKYGAQVVLGNRACRLAGTAMEVRPLELIDEPGSGLPTEVYELLGAEGTLTEEAMMRRDAFWEGIVCLRSNLTDDAQKNFDRASLDGDDDPVLKFFLAVARGESPMPVNNGESDNDDDINEDDEAIPPVFFRESDSVDTLEMIADIEMEDSDESQVPEKKS
ncbi:MAG: hypothetical protein ACI9R3_004481 [Verrucomicrobiales bacterium]|jgi:hypothetical protein